MRELLTLLGLMVCLGASACAGGGRGLDDEGDDSDSPDASAGDAPRILALTSSGTELGIGRCAYEATTLRGCDFVTPACDGSPLPRNGAGDITVSDGSAQWVLHLQGGLYASTEAPPEWAESELTVSAPGADIPAFSLKRKAPVTLTVRELASRMHPSDEPLEVSWTGGAVDFQILELGTQGGSGGQDVKRCLIDGSARSYTLTPDDLAFLGAPAVVQICVDGIVTDSVTKGGWLIEASSRASGVCTSIELLAP